jgi:hypothetical protein
MDTTKRLVIVAALALALFLASCAPGTPITPVQTAPSATEAPASPGPEGYPQPLLVDPSQGTYPGPGGDVSNYVVWGIAEAALMEGRVAQVFQNETWHVTLVLKDGTVMLALSPAADEVQNIIQRCGDACQGLEVGQ